jgi:hypothetical protein
MPSQLPQQAWLPWPQPSHLRQPQPSLQMSLKSRHPLHLKLPPLWRQSFQLQPFKSPKVLPPPLHKQLRP